MNLTQTFSIGAPTNVDPRTSDDHGMVARPKFTWVTSAITRLFDAPVAIVSLFDDDRQWFLDCAGLPAAAGPSMPLLDSLCQFILIDQHAVLVNDAARDRPEMARHPAAQDHGICSYMGAPIRDRHQDDKIIGSVCVMDVRRHNWDSDDLVQLQGIVGAVAGQLDAAALDRQLVSISKTQAHIVESVPHELRTPLTTILGNTEMLLLDELGELSTMQQQAVRSTHSSARRLLTMVENFLVLSGLESAPGRQLVDMAAAARRAAEAVESSGRHVTITASNDTVTVAADRRHIELMLTCLLENVVRHTTGARVEVIIQDHGDRVETTVADDGQGMSATEIELLRQRFARSESGVQRHVPGVGLGLASVARLAAIYEGTFDLAPNSSGGLSATISLPAFPHLI